MTLICPQPVKGAIRNAWARCFSLVIALIAGSFLALFSIGCTGPTDTTPGTHYRIPWLTESGSYRLQTIEIKTLENPQELQGSIAKIFVDPYLEGDSLKSQSIGRFVRTEDGILVPADFATLQATAVYAHTERLYEMDQVLGIASLLKWPDVIGIHTHVEEANKNLLVDNALYDGRLDSLLVASYVENYLPITVNAGILAHEHFHKIFQALVMNRLELAPQTVGKPQGLMAHKHHHNHDHWGVLPESQSESQTGNTMDLASPGAGKMLENHRTAAYNELVLRGLNEGLADFWAWVYTGDTSFIEHSLRGPRAQARRLDGPSERMLLPDQWKRRLIGRFGVGAVDPGLSYEFGTQYARFLRQLTLKSSGTEHPDFKSRLQVALALVQALPKIGDNLRQMNGAQNISPNILVQPLFQQLPKVNDQACAILAEFVALEAGYREPGPCQGIMVERSESLVGQEENEMAAANAQRGTP